jgi:hypothetical protein
LRLARRKKNEQGAAKVQDFRARLFGLLTAANYKWPDDLPFVRVSKSHIKALGPACALESTGKIQDWGAELLSLTPSEREKFETVLASHSEALAQAAAARAYTTNYLPTVLAERLSGKSYKSVWLPPASDAGPQPLEALRADLGQVLGNERAQILPAVEGVGALWPVWLLNYGRAGSLLTVSINPNHPEGVEIGIYRDANGGEHTVPNQNEVSLEGVPNYIAVKFFDPWLEQMGITNVLTRPKP